MPAAESLSGWETVARAAVPLPPTPHSPNLQPPHGGSCEARLRLLSPKPLILAAALFCFVGFQGVANPRPYPPEVPQSCFVGGELSHLSRQLVSERKGRVGFFCFTPVCL